MNNQRRPATKPAHLKATPTSAITAETSSALQGATSAFQPKSLATTSTSLASAAPSASSSLPSAGARLAARAAVPLHSQPLTSSLSRSQDEPAGPLPDRGRSIQPTKEVIGSSSSSRVTPVPQSTLTVASSPGIYRSPSAIAARHASSNSASPSRSPQRITLTRSNSRQDGHAAGTSTVDYRHALSGALASVASSPVEHEFDSVPVRNRMLNFENIPGLTPSAARVPPGRKTPNEPSRSPNDRGVTALQSHTVASQIAAARDRSRSLVSLAPPRPELSRGPSNSSALSAATRSTSSASLATVNDVYRLPPLPVRGLPRATTGSNRIALSANNSYSGLTVDSLANAMVASSLASSRAASPAKYKPPIPAPRRRSRSFSALYDIMASQQNENPVKPKHVQRPMKHTLRQKSDSIDDEVELVKRGRRHWMRKHPNMHSEGDRRRWRDTVTDRERKRYEGVFAANRGLLIGPGYFEPTASNIVNAPEGNKVANVIVRDIWERSRLPQDVLMEIYDLVAPDDDRALSRERFVVGMWLIDQRLKGRKLPTKVSSSVWSSVRHPGGIQLKGRAT